MGLSVSFVGDTVSFSTKPLLPSAEDVLRSVVVGVPSVLSWLMSRSLFREMYHHHPISASTPGSV